MDRLKSGFDGDSRLGIPEMALLQEMDWMGVARERSLGSDANLRASLAVIRSRAKSRFAGILVAALSAYVKANDGRMPPNASDLQPYIPASNELAALRAMLDRYEIPSQGSVTEIPDKAVLILESETATIDRDYDTRWRITRMVSARDADPFTINTLGDHIPGPLAPPPIMHLR